jgi:nucleotide-binding universal stress UspA family protein
MYHTIVVAFDGSDAGADALHQAADLAHATRAQLHLLGVVVSSGGLLLDPAIVPLDVLEVERQALLAALLEVDQALRHRGVVAQTVIRDGDPGREIIAYVEEVRADLVVIGPGHKGVMARWIEGSVSADLLDAMPCSVLVATRAGDPAAA